MGGIIAKRELIETSNRAIYWTSPLLMSPIQLGTTKHSCVLNVSWKKSNSLHVTCDCRALIEIRSILSELYFMEFSDTKNVIVSKVNVLLSKGRKGGGDLQRDVRWEDRPASTPAVTQTTVVIYDRRLHTFSTMKFTILAIDNWIWPKVQVYHIQQILFNTFFYNEEVAIIKRKYNSTLCIVYVANF